MTIALSANTPRVSYTVSQGATQTSFTVPFVFFTASTDLNVFVDGTERTFDASTSSTTLYTVSGGNGSTGTVTTSVTGVTGGSTVVITRDIPLSRTTDFPSSGAFEIAKLNTELDTVTAIQSDFNDNVDRTIRLQEFDDAATMTLPLKDARKGTVLGFNATTGAVEAGPTITAVQSLSDVTASIALLGTSAVVTDMGLLATSANVTAMGHLGTSANVTAMGLLGTSAVVADMALLGTSDVVADMALLATTDVIADMAQLANTTIIDDLAQLANTTITDDMAILATSDNVTAMGVLGTSANVTAMGLLGTSAVVEDMGFLGTSANVTAMGHLGTSANVTAMGLLGTSAVVTDMGILGTTAIVEDMGILATSANVTAMGLLGTSSNVTAMGLLGTSAVIEDLGLLATSAVIEDMGLLATSANITNMATLGASGVVTNIATVASNVSGVNSFADRYRVASSAPSSSLDVGDLYFDTTANELKVYKSSGWAAAGSTVNGTSERFTYNITGTPTTLTGASGTGFAEANSNTLAYDAGFIDVYLNGVKMVNGTDVTVTSGTSVVFASALSSGDVVDIVTFGTFQVATLNASNLASGTVPVARVSGSYTSITGTGALDAGSITSGFGNIDTGSSTITTTGAITGGTLTGTLQTAAQTNITSVGTLSALAVSGATTITTADNTAQLELVSTDADSGIGPHQVFYRNSSSPADDDLLCELDFRGRNDNSQDVDYATINVKATDVSDGTEDGQFILQTKQAGSTVDRMNLSSAETVFNEDSKDIDFRVESDGNANMLKVDASVNGVAIGGGVTSGYQLQINNASGSVQQLLSAGANFNSTIAFGDPDANTSGEIIYAHNGDSMRFHTNATERVRINSNGYFHVSQDISDSTFYNATYTNSFSHSNTQPVLFLENSGDGNVYGLVIDFTDATPDNNTSYFMLCQDNSVDRFRIWSDGDVVNHDNSYGSTSDIKLKEQIKDASSQWEDIKALKIRKYKMKEDVAKGDSDAHWRLGVIAQELETANMNGLVKDNPELVTNSDGEIEESGTTTKSVKYSILYMKAVKALQEAMTRIEALEAKVTALENAE